MGYHATVHAALADLIRAAVPPGCAVVDGLSLTEAQAVRLSHAVVIIRERIDLEPHAEINPSTDVDDQPETWTWTLYAIGGGGARTTAGAGEHVDTLLETLRAALNAQRLTAQCGPLRLVSEIFTQQHGAGVIYSQEWTHRRLAS